MISKFIRDECYSTEYERGIEFHFKLSVIYEMTAMTWTINYLLNKDSQHTYLTFLHVKEMVVLNKPPRWNFKLSYL